MEAPGRVRGMRRPHEPRGQPHFVLPPNLYKRAPGRGDFLVSNFHPGAIPGNLVRNDFWQSGRSWRGSRVACFWATSLEKIFGGTTTPTRSNGRLIRCTVPGSTPNRLARLAPRASQASPFATSGARSQATRNSRRYAFHAPEVECIGRGKASAPYEFGVKASVVTTNARAPGGQFVLHARTLPGNPYDGHTLGAVIEATE